MNAFAHTNNIYYAQTLVKKNLKKCLTSEKFWCKIYSRKGNGVFESTLKDPVFLSKINNQKAKASVHIYIWHRCLYLFSGGKNYGIC